MDNIHAFKTSFKGITVMSKSKAKANILSPEKKTRADVINLNKELLPMSNRNDFFDCSADFHQLNIFLHALVSSLHLIYDLCSKP